MTEAEAKQIINHDTPTGSIAARIEALDVAYSVLGLDATISQVYAWAEGRNNDGKRNPTQIQNSMA